MDSSTNSRKREGNPWHTLASRTVYENPWIRVREDEVIRPDGQPGIYGVVETRIATAAVAITAKLDVVLVGQYRYPVNEYSWEVIEGGAHPDEDPLQTVQRELQEEAGLLARQWEQLGPEIHLSNCYSSEISYAFLARDLSPTEASPDATELLEIRRASFSECFAMIEQGEIKDALSIIALERAARRLGVIRSP